MSPRGGNEPGRADADGGGARGSLGALARRLATSRIGGRRLRRAQRLAALATQPHLALARPLSIVAAVLVLLVGLALLGGMPGTAMLDATNAASACGVAAGASPGAPPGAFAEAPGALGGLGGTGITQEDADAVGGGRQTSRITPGSYVATAYGPPWGGINGPGEATSAGLRLDGEAPRKYFVAVDPAVISYGAWVYIWPNPFSWRGPFLAADTGGAIDDRRIDFYDWRGRASQNAWGRRPVQVSARPIVGGADAGGATDPTDGADVAAAAPEEVGPGGGSASGPPTAATGADGLDAAACAPPSGDGATLTGVGHWVQPSGGDVDWDDAVNAPGKPMQGVLIDYVRATSAIAGRPLVITTGTRHSVLTASGNVSDHVFGLGADLHSGANRFSDDGPGGTAIAAAALRVAGVPEGQASRLAAAGGRHDVCARDQSDVRWRVQIIWRSMTGGNHYDHVHIGLRRGCDFTGVRTIP